MHFQQEVNKILYIKPIYMTYVYLDEFETAGRRVAKFADVLASVWDMEHQYEVRVCAVSNKEHKFLSAAEAD
jgi:hypothetical protein